MSIWSMVTPLLDGLELTPGQQAEMRAIDALYYTALARNENPPSAGSVAATKPMSDSDIAILVISRVRAMLGAEQRAELDRRLAARQSEKDGGDARPVRHS